MKRGWWQHSAKNFFIKNFPLIFFVIFIFVVGVIFGSLAIRTLDGTKRLEMLDFLSNFFSGLVNNLADQTAVNFWDSVFLNLKISFFMWILSLSIIGIIGIPILVFLRGFVIGFTVGFLVKELGLQGMIFALASILPQNLLIIPATIFSAVLAIAFGITLLKSLLAKRQINLGYNLLNYTFLMILMGGALVIASLVETFITPILMELVARFVIKK